MSIIRMVWLYSGALLWFSDGSLRYLTADEVGESVSLIHQKETR